VALLAGSRIGPYELLELLGTGGMGEVYRARDPRLGREVAIKVLPERFAHSADRVARFEREARAAGSLSHPNVLTVFDVGSQDGIHYLVSELLEGETMQAFLRFERPSLRQSLLLALEVARGLACAHQAGILHRDLKPENLFLTRAGPLKILDFGLAKLVQPDDGASPLSRTVTRDTDTGGLLGTAAYMSPEQIRDEPLDGRSDIFALGAILYELLSQRPAFKGTNRSDVMASVLRDEPPALAEAGVVAPAGVEAIVRRCLAKRRENRFGSARELAIALEAVSGAESDVALLGPTRRRLLRPARQSWVAALALIAIRRAGSDVLRKPVGPDGCRQPRADAVGSRHYGPRQLRGLAGGEQPAAP
jgi:serine/threonine protein kinase